MADIVSNYEFCSNIHPQIQVSQYNKGHNIFDKDVYRYMKTEKIVDKALVKKPSGVKTILEYNNNKYKTRSQLIMEQYENPTITEDKLYLIDKVVR